MFAKLRFRRHRERLYTWIIAIAGIGCAIGAAYLARDYAHRLADEGFKREISVRNGAFDGAIARHEQMVRSLAAFIATRDTISGTDFRAFVETMRGEPGGIQAMQWMPRVTAAERAAFEQAASVDFPDGYHITEQVSPGEIAPAPAREEYFPVRLVEPLAGNEPTVGLDLLSEPLHEDAAGRLVDGKDLTATERLVLLQEQGVQYGVMLLAPVHARDGTLRGYVAGVFRIGDLLENALTGVPPVGLHINVTDATGPGAERALHVFSDRLSDVGDLLSVPAQARPEGTTEDLLVTHDIAFADRVWRIYYETGPGYYAPVPPVPAWFAALLVLVATAFVTSFLLLMQKRAQLLARQSLSDGLTGVANRAFCDRLLTAEWDRAVRYGKPFSVVIIDIDRFSTYNAELGPMAGDGCLRRVANALEHVPGRSSDLVCRYAGDRFAIVLPETGTEGAHELARRVNKSIEALQIPFPGDGGANGDGVVTVSVVAASAVPRRGDSLQVFMTRATDVLDSEERMGGNIVIALTVASS